MSKKINTSYPKTRKLFIYVPVAVADNTKKTRLPLNVNLQCTDEIFRARDEREQKQDVLQ